MQQVLMASKITKQKTTASKMSANNRNNNDNNGDQLAPAKRITKPTSASKSMQGKASKLIKKSHVRFDDYMDLNEENMRRSCKLLMNRLYSTRDGAGAQASTSDNDCDAAQKNIHGRASPPPPPRSSLQPIPAPNSDEECKDNTNEDDGSADKALRACGGISSKILVAESSSTAKSGLSLTSAAVASRANSEQLASSHQPAAPQNGKSYLRSQYERRQKRQLELMSGENQQASNMASNGLKMNLNSTTMGGPPTSQASGACYKNGHVITPERSAGSGKSCSDSNTSSQQQDMVAKSHELSKRRFFEKLEHRESLRNSNLRTRNVQLQTPNSRLAQGMQIQPTKDSKIFNVDERRKFLALREEKYEEEEAEEFRVASRSVEREPSEKQVKRSSLNTSKASSSSCEANNENELMLKAFSHTHTLSEQAAPHSLVQDTPNMLGCPQSPIRQQSVPASLSKTSYSSSARGLRVKDLLPLANELIGFHMQPRQLVGNTTSSTSYSSSNASERLEVAQSEKKQLQQCLIELSLEPSMSAKQEHQERASNNQSGLSSISNVVAQLVSPTGSGGFSLCETHGEDEQTRRRRIVQAKAMACNNNGALECGEDLELQIDESAFEIKVPASQLTTVTCANGSYVSDRKAADEFGGLLVVRQVEEISNANACSQAQVTLDGATVWPTESKEENGAQERPHTLIGRQISGSGNSRKEGSNNSSSTRAVDKARALESNKTLPHANVDYYWSRGANDDESTKTMIGIQPYKETAASSSPSHEMTEHRFGAFNEDDHRLYDCSAGESSARLTNGEQSGGKSSSLLAISRISQAVEFKGEMEAAAFVQTTIAAVASPADVSGIKNNEELKRSSVMGTLKEPTTESAGADSSFEFGSSNRCNHDGQCSEMSNASAVPVSIRGADGCVGQDQIEQPFASTCKQAICPVGELKLGNSAAQEQHQQQQEQQKQQHQQAQAVGANLKFEVSDASQREANATADADEVADAIGPCTAKTMITTRFAIRDVLPEANGALNDRLPRQMAKVEAANVSDSGASLEAASAAASAAAAPTPSYDVEADSQWKQAKSAERIATSACCGQQQQQLVRVVGYDTPQQVNEAARKHKEIERDEPARKSLQRAQRSNENQSHLHEELDSDFNDDSPQSTDHGLQHYEKLRLSCSKLQYSESKRQYANPLGGTSTVSLTGNNVNHDDRRAAQPKEPCSPSASSSSSGMISACGSNLTTKDAIQRRNAFEQEMHLIEPCVSGPAIGQACEFRSDQMNGQENPYETPAAVTNHQRNKRTCTSAIEEDVGSSSCSSSGFGASVSVTSASSASSNTSRSPTIDSLKENHDYPCKVKFSNNQQLHDCSNGSDEPQRQPQQHPLYDTTCGIRSRLPMIKQIEDEFPDYKQLVGPDQAYPSKKERPLVIENYGYASLVNRCQVVTQSSPMAGPHDGEDFKNLPAQCDKEFKHCSNSISEVSQYRVYANLPVGKLHNQRQQQEPPVEYATVRASTTLRARVGAASNGVIPAENKSHSTNRPSSVASESSLSGQSYSGNSSAESGGFSKLPPARIIDCPFANNFQPLSETAIVKMSDRSCGHQQEQHQQARKSSLFKKFGSLVSKAFASSADCSVANQALTSHQMAEVKLETAERPSELQSSLKVASSTSMDVGQRHHQESAGKSIDQISPEASVDSINKFCIKLGGDDTLLPSAIDTSQQHVSDNARKSSPSKNQVALLRCSADLVILPPKHQKVTEKKQYSLESSKALNRAAHDKLSRTVRRSVRSKHHQRRHRETSSTNTSSTRSSEACFSSLAGTSESDYKRSSGRHASNIKSERRRASSLSEELESLMSRSEVDDSQAASRIRQNNTDDIMYGSVARDADISAHSNRVGKQAFKQEATIRIKSKRERYSDGGNCSSGSKKLPAKSRIDIDCVSPVLITATRQASAQLTDYIGGDLQSLKATSTSGRSRSLLKWFSTTASSSTNSASRQQNELNETTELSGSICMRNKNCEAIKKNSKENLYDTNGQASENSLLLQEQQQPASGLWGFSSLIEHGHASLGDKTKKASADHSLQQCKLRALPALARNRRDSEKKKRAGIEMDKNKHEVNKEPTSLIYSHIKRSVSKESDLKVRKAALDESKPNSVYCSSDDCCLSVSGISDSDEDEFVLNGANKSFQSLNLYQNLLRNYVQRRDTTRHHSRHGQSLHSRHHSHHHHHHHHRHRQHHDGHRHHHHHHHSNRGHHQHKHHSSRHAHCLATATRCGQNCSTSLSQPCLSDSNHQTGHNLAPTKGDKRCASVWGQLIKINKSDGSQVIELQRLPGMSWGFFVARGALKNVKGIFISRMHDTATRSSLSGLLSIGDRILSIDDCTIGPDHDILQVNQMISKKTKISLRVKPFKN